MVKSPFRQSSANLANQISSDTFKSPWNRQWYVLCIYPRIPTLPMRPSPLVSNSVKASLKDLTKWKQKVVLFAGICLAVLRFWWWLQGDIRLVLLEFVEFLLGTNCDLIWWCFFIGIQWSFNCDLAVISQGFSLATLDARERNVRFCSMLATISLRISNQRNVASRERKCTDASGERDTKTSQWESRSQKRAFSARNATPNKGQENR